MLISEQKLQSTSLQKKRSTSLMEYAIGIEDEAFNLKRLLKQEDEDGNTPLHLSLQNRHLGVTRTILKFLEQSQEDGKEAFMQGSKFGWKPFSGAVSSGDMETHKPCAST